MTLTIAYPPGHSSTDWGVIISDGENAGAPDDNAIYLFSKKVIRNKKTMDKTNLLSDRKAKRKARGKISINMNLPSIFIPTRSMTEVNLIGAKIDTWMAKGHAPIYMWIRTKVSGSWVYMDFPLQNGTQVDYLMGYIDSWTDDIDEFFLAKCMFSNAYEGF